MGTSGFIRGLYSFSTWIIKFTTTNVLWLIFNLPIVYLVLNMLSATTPDELIINFITIAILLPFVLFPATTAMFGIIRQWVIGNTDISLIRSFWKYYKNNYLRSLFGGLIITFLTVILLIDYYYFTSTNSPLFYIFLLISMFTIVFITHFFSNTVHVNDTLFISFKNSFLLSVGNPVYTIGITIFIGIIAYISINVYTILIFLGSGSLMAYLSFLLYYKSQSNLTAENSSQ